MSREWGSGGGVGRGSGEGSEGGEGGRGLAPPPHLSQQSGSGGLKSRPVAGGQTFTSQLQVNLAQPQGKREGFSTHSVPGGARKTQLLAPH